MLILRLDGDSHSDRGENREYPRRRRTLECKNIMVIPPFVD
jgi:hypothetical protein